MFMIIYPTSFSSFIPYTLIVHLQYPYRVESCCFLLVICFFAWMLSTNADQLCRNRIYSSIICCHIFSHYDWLAIVLLIFIVCVWVSSNISGSSYVRCLCCCHHFEVTYFRLYDHNMFLFLPQCLCSISISSNQIRERGIYCCRFWRKLYEGVLNFSAFDFFALLYSATPVVFLISSRSRYASWKCALKCTHMRYSSEILFHMW